MYHIFCKGIKYRYEKGDPTGYLAICLALILSQQSGAIHILRYFQREGVTKMMHCGDFHRKLKEDGKKGELKNFDNAIYGCSLSTNEHYLMTLPHTLFSVHDCSD